MPARAEAPEQYRQLEESTDESSQKSRQAEQHFSPPFLERYYNLHVEIQELFAAIDRLDEEEASEADLARDQARSIAWQAILDAQELIRRAGRLASQDLGARNSARQSRLFSLKELDSGGLGSPLCPNLEVVIACSSISEPRNTTIAVC